MELRQNQPNLFSGKKMLNDCLKTDDHFTPAHHHVRNLHQKGLLLSRTVRSFRECLINNEMDSVVNDLTEEIDSLKAGINSKHVGKHFATVILLAKKPICPYHCGIGFLFDLSKLKVEVYCESDARDDNGTKAKDVRTTKNHNEYLQWINSKKSNHQGLIENYPEAQVYCTQDACLGIFATINRHHYENEIMLEQANVKAYLNAIIIGNFIYNKFKINMPIYIYDVRDGAVMRPATRAPNSDQLKKLVQFLCLTCESDLGLPQTDHSKLNLIINRLEKHLSISWQPDERHVLIQKIISASREHDAQITIESFHQQMEQSYMPKSITMSYHPDAGDSKFYSLAIPFELNHRKDVWTRLSALLKYIKIKFVEDNPNNQFVVMLTLEQVSVIQKYFYSFEPKSLKNLSEAYYEEYNTDLTGPQF